jgi:hypothetical protein
MDQFNPLNAELNPICNMLALLAHHILHVSTIGVKWVRTDLHGLTPRSGTFHLLRVVKQVRHDDDDELFLHVSKLFLEK